MIPSLLKNEKDPEWLTWGKIEEKCPYFHIFGRICESDKSMNPSTLPLILHCLVKKFDTSLESSTLFQNGLYMKWNDCYILVELKSYHKSASVKIALSIDNANDNRKTILDHLKKSGEYLDTIFTETVCGIVRKQNPSLRLKRFVISLERMKQGDDVGIYEFDTVFRRFWDFGHEEVSSKEFEESDQIVSLLTPSEMKMGRKSAEVCTLSYDCFIVHLIQPIIAHTSELVASLLTQA